MSIQQSKPNNQNNVVEDALRTLDKASRGELSEEEQRNLEKTIASASSGFHSMNRAQRRSQDGNQNNPEAREESIQDVQNNLLRSLFSQGRGFYDKNVSAINKSKIQEVYDDFDNDSVDTDLFIKNLEEKGIPSQLVDSFHYRMKYGMKDTDDTFILKAYFHGPVSVKVEDNNFVLDEFYQEIILPKSWDKQPVQEVVEEKKSKKKKKRKNK